MLHLSRFAPDYDRLSEFLAILWQGSVPDSLVLHRYLYTASEPLGMVLLWEGDSVAEAHMERVWGQYGELSTEIVTDATGSLLAALNRDLDGFGAILQERGWSAEEIADSLEIRRRGMEAESHQDAVEAGRAFDREHAPVRRK